MWSLQLNAAVGRNETGAAFLLEGFAGVGPVEGMGHGRVVVDDERSDLDSSSGTEVKLPPRRHFRWRMPKKISIWLSHELCFGR